MGDERAPLVSVVIPCYKQAHFLGEAIESVLAQSHRPVEIIVVDDGSPDDTAAVAARYPEVRYTWQPNQGRPAATRNAGLQKAQGELVVFLDADDRLRPGALAIGVRTLLEHPECAFACGHTELITHDGRPYEYHRLPCRGASYEALLVRNPIECPASVMYRRRVLENLGGFDVSPDMKAVEDYELYLRIARQYPTRCHHHTVSDYRRHGDGISQDHARMLRGSVRLFRRQEALVRGDPAREAAWREGREFFQQYYGEQLVNQMRERVRRRDWRNVARAVVTLLRYYPRGVRENAGRKLRRLVPGIGPAKVAAPSGTAQSSSRTEPR